MTNSLKEISGFIGKNEKMSIFWKKTEKKIEGKLKKLF